MNKRDKKLQEILLNFKEIKEERCPSCGAKLKIEIFDFIIRRTCGMCPYEQTENKVGKDKEVEEAIFETEFLIKDYYKGKYKKLTAPQVLALQTLIDAVKRRQYD